MLIRNAGIWSGRKRPLAGQPAARLADALPNDRLDLGREPAWWATPKESLLAGASTAAKAAHHEAAEKIERLLASHQAKEAEKTGKELLEQLNPDKARFVRTFLDSAAGGLRPREPRSAALVYAEMLRHDSPYQALSQAFQSILAGRGTYRQVDYGQLGRRFFERCAHHHPNTEIARFIETTLAEGVLKENDSFIALISGGLKHTRPGVEGFYDFAREAVAAADGWDRNNLAERTFHRLAWFEESNAWGRAALSLIHADLQGRTVGKLSEELIKNRIPRTDSELVANLTRAVAGIKIPNDQFRAAQGALTFLVQHAPPAQRGSIVRLLGRMSGGRERKSDLALEGVRLLTQLTHAGPFDWNAGRAEGWRKFDQVHRSERQAVEQLASGVDTWLHADLLLETVWDSQVNSISDRGVLVEALASHRPVANPRELHQLVSRAFLQTEVLDLGLEGLRRLASLPELSRWAGAWEAAVVNLSHSSEAQSSMLKSAFSSPIEEQPLPLGRQLVRAIKQLEPGRDRYEAALGATLYIHKHSEGPSREVLGNVLDKMSRPDSADTVESRAQLALIALEMLSAESGPNPLDPDIDFGEDSIDIGPIILPRH